MASAPGVNFSAIWTAGGIVVGFSVTAFIFRIRRESDIRSGLVPGEKKYWLPPADFVLLASLAAALVGVFVVPVLGAGLDFARYALGWSLLLLAGYPFALAGHYDIVFGKVPTRTMRRRREKGYPWCTKQEKGVLFLLAAASVAYFLGVFVRELA